MKRERGDINNSLDKALMLLTYFTEENPVLGLSAISRLSKIPKATVYRLLNTFEKNGYLKKVDISGKQNQYALGMKFLELGYMVADSIEIKQIALPFMEKLRDKLNEDVHLVERHDDHAIYIEKLGCSHPVRLFTKMGKCASLNAGASPRALLTFLEDDEIHGILHNIELVAITENTITDRESLWKQINEDRRKGYCISYGETTLNTVEVAVPIFDHKGKPIASISTAGPEHRFCKSILSNIIQSTQEIGKEISKALGYIDK